MKRSFLMAFAVFIYSPLVLPAQDAVNFTEVSKDAGINHAFEVDLATFGGGVAVLDFDNDGWEDLYITGGKANDALFKNMGDGTFTNVFQQAGFDRTTEVYTQGVSAADINRDGYKDIVVTTMNDLGEIRSPAPNLLYLNNGNGTFTEITKSWGLEDLRTNSQGASFGDINADGYPDLYISNYFSSAPINISIYNENTIVNSFSSARDYLFLNVGGTQYIEVGELYGMNHFGYGFGGLFTDFDNDSDLDLFIANDFGFRDEPNVLLRNDFPERKLQNRALNLAWNYGMNAMGIARTDYNNDGWMDYYVTNLGASLFTENQTEGQPFLDRSIVSGLGLPTLQHPDYNSVPISWGAIFFDFDHDTDEDLFVCNGALNPTTRINPNLFFERFDELFVDFSVRYGLDDVQIGRGAAVFDYDKDGDLDLFVVNQKPRDPISSLPETRSLLYRNDNGNGNWLQVELAGVQADKNGIGSRVEAMVDGKLLIREIDGGSSHLSQNTTIAHFGLGEATTIESITVKWVGGNTQTITNVAVNQKIVIQEAPNSESGFSDDKLNVFPTVLEEELFIEFEQSNSAPAMIDLIDTQGRILATIANYSQPINTGFFRWNPSQTLSPGVYFVRLTNGKNTMAKKVIKY